MFKNELPEFSGYFAYYDRLKALNLPSLVVYRRLRMDVIIYGISRRTVVSRKAKKKQHACMCAFRPTLPINMATQVLQHNNNKMHIANKMHACMQ